MTIAYPTMTGPFRPGAEAERLRRRDDARLARPVTEAAGQRFLTGSAAEVTPVSEIGPYRFEAVEIARTLMNAYSAAVRPELATAAEKQKNQQKQNVV